MQHPIADILDRIEQRVAESHGDVINALFAHIDHKLQLMEAEAQKCSYAGVLCDYVHFKVMAHHMRKHIDDMYVVRSAEIEHLRERLYDYERRARIVRAGMYSNVCRTCKLCKTRNKAWPDYTQFKDESREGPTFYRNEEKVTFGGAGTFLKFQTEMGETVTIPAI